MKTKYLCSCGEQMGCARVLRVRALILLHLKIDFEFSTFLNTRNMYSLTLKPWNSYEIKEERHTETT